MLTHQDYYYAVLLALNELGGSGQVEEINNKTVELANISQEELDSRYEKSGALIVPDRISWSRTYLRTAGLIKNEGRGLWLLTERSLARRWGLARPFAG